MKNLKAMLSRLIMLWSLSFFPFTLRATLGAEGNRGLDFGQTSTPSLFPSNFLQFKYLTVNDGFSRNTIFDICQDRNGLIWFGTWDGLYKYDGIHLDFVHRPELVSNKADHIVFKILEDQKHRIWMETADGAKIWDPVKERELSLSDLHVDKAKLGGKVDLLGKDKAMNVWLSVGKETLYVCSYDDAGALTLHLVSSTLKAKPNVLYAENDSLLWVGTRSQGLYKIVLNKEKGWTVTKCALFQSFDKTKINMVFHDDVNGDYWVGTDHSLFKVSGADEQDITSFRYHQQKTKVSDIDCDGRYVYATTSHGLFLYSLKDKKADWIVPDYSTPGGLNDKSLYTISIDREKNVWLGSSYGGVNLLTVTNNNFLTYAEINRHLDGHVVSCVAEDKHHNIWLGVEDGSLTFWNRQNNTSKLIKRTNNKNLEDVVSLFACDERIYVGTSSGGFSVLDLQGNVLSEVNRNSRPLTFPHTIYSFQKNAEGQLLLGTYNGLYLLDLEKMKVERIKEISNKVNCIEVNERGDAWVASFSGLYNYSRADGRWHRFSHQPQDSCSIVCNEITTVKPIGASIYFGTQYKGLWVYSVNMQQFRPVAPETLGSTIVFKIIPSEDDLWITTNRGLYVYNLTTRHIKQYTAQDGLRSNQFKLNSGIQTFDKLFVLGGLNGINCFHPSDLKGNSIVPKVNLTALYLFNNRVNLYEEKCPLDSSITYSQQIELNQAHHSFAFQFSSTSYCDPVKNKYEYKLEPFEKEWQRTHGKSTMAHYTNIPAGKYVFHVRTSNGEGVWSEERCIDVVVHPYWWLALPMKLLYYTLFLTFVGWGIFRYRNKKQRELRMLKLKQEQELNQVKMQQEKETYRTKMEFFTCMVHEIRTPLTLILGPLSSVKKKETKTVKEVEPDLQIIERNGKRLLSLVNQLMDFRKVEERAYEVHPVSLDMKKLILHTTRDFRYYNVGKNIHFELDMPDGECWAKADSEALTKVLFNLLSNAAKFTKDSVRVGLQKAEAENCWELSVKDNGCGITADEQASIFESFYQVRQNMPGDYVGTGVGLFVVRRLVELQNGHISVKSELNEGATFTVQIPCSEAAILPEVAAEEVAEDKGEGELVKTIEVAKKRILVAEDNEEMRQYVISLFEENYEIEGFRNGVEALEAIEKGDYDLVITDLMMPEMDGLTLCRTLKKQTETSHIPVLILTAKVDEHSQMEGFESEADMYVTKPFSAEVLQSRVKSLLSNREHLRSLFYREPETSSDILCGNPNDEKFLVKLNSLIEQNIEESNLPIDDLAKEMGMSRAVFYRKVKGVFGLTPNDYIRTVRLKKAIAMFKNGETRINEVCYRVGFSSPSYFTKRFTQQFGISPSDFVKQNS